MGNVEQVISKKWPRLIDACTQLKKRGSKQALSSFLTRNYKFKFCFLTGSVTVEEDVTMDTSDDDDIMAGSETGSDEFEMEITDDMLKFFAHSAKHKLLRG